MIVILDLARGNTATNIFANESVAAFEHVVAESTLHFACAIRLLIEVEKRVGLARGNSTTNICASESVAAGEHVVAESTLHFASGSIGCRSCQGENG